MTEAKQKVISEIEIYLTKTQHIMERDVQKLLIIINKLKETRFLNKKETELVESVVSKRTLLDFNYDLRDLPKFPRPRSK